VQERARLRAQVLDREAAALRPSDRAMHVGHAAPLDDVSRAARIAADHEHAGARQLGARASAAGLLEQQALDLLAHAPVSVSGSVSGLLSGRPAKRALPMRTTWLPSSIAISKSSLMPIESSGGVGNSARSSRASAAR